jgi:hypothetical protein
VVRKLSSLFPTIFSNLLIVTENESSSWAIKSRSEESNVPIIARGCEIYIYHQPIAVLHQDMSGKTQLRFFLLSFLANFASASVVDSWVSLVCWRSRKSMLGFFSSPKDGLPPPSLGGKLFSEAQTSNKVPSTIKWSSERSLRGSAYSSTFTNNSLAI